MYTRTSLEFAGVTGILQINETVILVKRVADDMYYMPS